MSDSPHITDVSRDTFTAQVIENSHRVPVLVDFWAEWCGPCQMQMPVLAKLLGEYDGKFVLAKINTDLERELAGEHGIRSLPTMHLYKNGKVVEEILGAQTERDLRAILERHIERASDKVLLAAMDLYRQGQPEEALARFREAIQGDPENHRLRLVFAQLALEQGRIDEAATTLDCLPAEVRDEQEASRLGALLEFARIAQDAAPGAELQRSLSAQPDNLEARYQLAAQQVMENRLEPAMEELLYILQQDRTFRDDAGRKGLLAIFKLLGNEGELVNRYRRSLFNAMH